MATPTESLEKLEDAVVRQAEAIAAQVAAAKPLGTLPRHDGRAEQAPTKPGTIATRVLREFSRSVGLPTDQLEWRAAQERSRQSRQRMRGSW